MLDTGEKYGLDLWIIMITIRPLIDNLKLYYFLI